MRAYLAIAHTGLVALLLHPGRSLVTALALVAILVPYLTILGISKGVEEEARLSLRFGPDLYITGSRFGRPSPVPLDVVSQVEAVEGVERVTPRIIGGVTLGNDREPAVVVGLPAERLPASVACVEGRLYGPGDRHEFVVGTELASRLGVRVGSVIPPFYRNDKGERTAQVVGIFRADAPLWQARLIFTPFDTAAAIFAQEGWATDLLVECEPGAEERVRGAIQRSVSWEVAEGTIVRPWVTTREDLDAFLLRGVRQREGVLNLLFVVAFAVAIGIVLVTAGFGLGERRREVGILKATGWQTDEVLLRHTVESFLLCLGAASLALLLAFVWLRGLNAYGIAAVYLAGVEAVPSFRVPFRLTPVPALLAFVISFVVVMSGTLFSTWRAATVAPRDALR